jgi:hypothetical protein
MQPLQPRMASWVEGRGWQPPEPRAKVACDLGGKKLCVQATLLLPSNSDIRHLILCRLSLPMERPWVPQQLCHAEPGVLGLSMPGCRMGVIGLRLVAQQHVGGVGSCLVLERCPLHIYHATTQCRGAWGSSLMSPWGS